MTVLGHYTRQLVEKQCVALRQPPFDLSDSWAMPLAVMLITEPFKTWDYLMLRLIQLTPTASVCSHVLRRYYPYPSPIYRTTNYRNWLRNAKPIGPHPHGSPQHSCKPQDVWHQWRQRR